MNPLPYVMVAPTGARRSTADHPTLPTRPDEIAQTARACFAAGAQALHLHVRDAAGRHSLDPGHYRDAIAAVTEAAPGMAIQVTTETAGRYGPAAQLALIRDLAPLWASVALRELAADPSLARRLYAMCRDQGTALQHIIYDAGDAARLGQWQQEGVLGPNEDVILVLGRYDASHLARVEDIAPFRASLPPVGRWMLCAFGPQEHACLHAAARLGADVRVGFENALTDAKGTPWPNVESSVAALTHSWRTAA
ncbi:MAG: 3-keto-5-aminohexanoate cleavage protein [Pseudomonadota bacterium]